MCSPARLVTCWLDRPTEVDSTVQPPTCAVVDFEYDNRGRLIYEERTVAQDDAYELWYSYDQLGNRLSKIDTVSGRWVEYDYDVELADPQVLDYPTWHNRLLQYRVYDDDPEDPETNLLRTVAYAYYKTGQASNITVKDEYVDAETTPGEIRHWRDQRTRDTC